MHLDVWLAYVATVAIVVVSPGPSVLLSSAHGMQHGPARTVATIAGDLSANVLQMTAASLGLGMALFASAAFFMILKWAGVGYLIFLGIRQWRGAPHWVDENGGNERKKDVSPARLYWQGFAVSASNPKAVLFFLALFPQFVAPSAHKLPQLLILGLTFVVMDGTTLTIYARCGARLRRWLAVKNRARWQQRITGSLLVLAAVYLSRARRLVVEATR